MTFEIETLDLAITVFASIIAAIVIYELFLKRGWGENHKGTKP